MKQFNILTIAFSVFLFTGCSILNESNDSFKFKYIQSTGITDFSDVAEELLDGVKTKMSFLDKRNPIYVVDFVNLKNLANNSHLGFILSEEMKAQVSQKLDIPVVSIEYMKYIKLGNNGSNFLTRDLKQIRTTKINTNTYALVGTYTFTQRQVIFYLKLIDLTNGVIIKSSTTSIKLTDEMMEFESKKQKSEEPVIFRPVTI